MPTTTNDCARGINYPHSNDEHRSQAGATLSTVLDAHVRAEPERPLFTFIDDTGRESTLSRGELHMRAQLLAAHLVARGLRGRRALLLHAPGLDFVVALWGCFHAGVVAVPAHPPEPTRLNRTLPRLLALIRDADVAIVLTQSMIEAMTGLLPRGSGLDELQWLATDRELPELPELPEELYRNYLIYLTLVVSMFSTDGESGAYRRMKTHVVKARKLPQALREAWGIEAHRDSTSM